MYPSGNGPSVRTMDEALEVVANGRAVVITAATIAEYYTRSDISFVRISETSSSVRSICVPARATAVRQ